MRGGSHAVAIVAEFDLKPGCEAEFNDLLLETARFALLEEPKCLRFGIIQPTDRDGNPIPSKLMTNELFEDFAGIEAYRAADQTDRRTLTGPPRNSCGSIRIG